MENNHLLLSFNVLAKMDHSGLFLPGGPFEPGGPAEPGGPFGPASGGGGCLAHSMHVRRNMGRTERSVIHGIDCC